MEQITCVVLSYIPGYLIKRQRLVWHVREISLLLEEEYVHDGVGYHGDSCHCL